MQPDPKLKKEGQLREVRREKSQGRDVGKKSEEVDEILYEAKVSWWEMKGREERIKLCGKESLPFTRYDV